jgi:hypothetical protein
MSDILIDSYGGIMFDLCDFTLCNWVGTPHLRIGADPASERLCYGLEYWIMGKVQKAVNIKCKFIFICCSFPNHLGQQCGTVCDQENDDILLFKDYFLIFLFSMTFWKPSTLIKVRATEKDPSRAIEYGLICFHDLAKKPKPPADGDEWAISLIMSNVHTSLAFMLSSITCLKFPIATSQAWHFEISHRDQSLKSGRWFHSSCCHRHSISWGTLRTPKKTFAFSTGSQFFVRHSSSYRINRDRRGFKAPQLSKLTWADSTCQTVRFVQFLHWFNLFARDPPDLTPPARNRAVYEQWFGSREVHVLTEKRSHALKCRICRNDGLLPDARSGAV